MSHSQMPSVTVGPNTFKYGSDPDHRQIHIWVDGLAGQNVWYYIKGEFTGHKPWEKKKPMVFNQLAEILGARYNAEEGWPQRVFVSASETVLGVDVTLERLG